MGLYGRKYVVAIVFAFMIFGDNIFNLFFFCINGSGSVVLGIMRDFGIYIDKFKIYNIMFHKLV